MKFRIARSAAVAALAGPLLLIAFDAQAHAHLVKATPAADASVSAPATVRLQFSEKLAPKFSGASVMTANGKPVPARASVSARTVNVTPRTRLTSGGYMVMWHVVSADGHKMKGEYNFTVR